MSDSSSNQSTGSQNSGQSGNDQTQSNKNPLLKRPTNPNLDIMVQKGSDKPFERNQKGERITEHKRGGDKPTTNSK